MGFERSAEWRLIKLGGWADTMMPRSAPHARPMLARIEEVATKLALVHALACNPECTRIRESSAEFGEMVARNSLGTILSGAKRFAAESEGERRVKRVAERIRQAGPVGLTMAHVTRALRGVSQRDRLEILATLVEAGDIVPVGQREGRLGRPPETVFVHRDHAEAAGLVH